MARTREAQFGPHATYVGIDVGKSFHWAYAVDADGNEVMSRRLENRQADVDALLAEAGGDALVERCQDFGHGFLRKSRRHLHLPQA